MESGCKICFFLGVWAGIIVLAVFVSAFFDAIRGSSKNKQRQNTKKGITVMNNEKIDEEIAVRFLRSKMGFKPITKKSCETCKYNDNTLCRRVKWLPFAVSDLFVCNAYVSVAKGQSNADIEPVEVDEP